MYRIYPNDKQIQKIEQTFGAVRWAWNYALTRKQDAYKNGSVVFMEQISKEITEIKKQDTMAWLQEVSSQAIQASLRTLNIAYKEFFNGTKKLPKLKTKKHSKNYFKCPQDINVCQEKNIIKIPVVGNVKAVIHRNYDGRIKTSTVKRTNTKKYFVVICVEKYLIPPRVQPLKKSTTIGIDLGIKKLAVCSNGIEFDNQNYLKKELKRIRILQKSVDRKNKQSNNREKSVLKLARLHEKISNRRRDGINKITKRLTTDSEIQTICIEDLNIKGMVKNKHLSKAIYDASFGIFIRQIKYKCLLYGRRLIEISRFYPSSKTCSKCGFIKDTLLLSERIYRCDKCGYEIDRDRNASINIKNIGFSGMDKPVEPVESVALVDKCCQRNYAL